MIISDSGWTNAGMPSTRRRAEGSVRRPMTGRSGSPILLAMRISRAADVAPVITSGAAILVEGLTKRYRRITAIDDLSFSVRRGAVTGFFGPNGAGKTTALKVMAGLARASAGQVLVNGSQVRSAALDTGLLGVFIEPCGAHPGRSGHAHLRSLATMAGLPSRRVPEVLAFVGLEQVARRRVGKYSLGMRQRLGLAAALLGDPEILVLDEPMNGLDPQGIRWLRTLLRERAESGRTVLLSSHMLTEAERTVDDVIVIHRGRVAHQGPIGALIHPSGRDVGGVWVRTPAPGPLATELRKAGVKVGPGAGGRLLIEGRDAAAVAELAQNARIPVHEIAARGASLEDLFLDLTGAEDA